MRIPLAFLGAAMIASATFATTWSVSEKVDPITGGKCQGIDIMSYGSYIYDWPSKYDGVYWPHTTMEWIWFCNDSGYVSFGDEFDELTDEERSAIGEFLKRHYVSSGDGMPDDRKLWLLEEINKLRNQNDQWWSWFHRVKANLYETLAESSRRRALPLLEASVGDLEPGADLVQIYFVIGDYHRRFGDVDKAESFWGKAKEIEWIDDDGQFRIGSEYINELIEDRRELIKKRE